ncbi:MAG: NAD(P)/FAD-dependent oxidoreductase [Hydrogenophaga sp.]|uniref:NAD(P)/FAD-dependent oxidoreductase n=1 Tax=Hydrogenophaga sp. TaxID=1904254 RepID=UPI000A69F832|nr:NAD(P)/FAD-dependent oxidoreductase [Hydrogenophaga sp.]MBU4182121.1 NAD(P)/FAD-dependent oxidoreductase [Gammaproteobacteria bacterium]MBU4280507.1 NAD(P)/FAD-dependent oxidoreductase [Gammaproteobacteria bacterium]MBU4322767.1 NAD(P)/FAD-dependent oxidoreductase [Gammaproteobacteria bacterium]MBU4507834.1 NAD(P)/FAD-dependent oxidoreductase [Gammaproteobacteria bacterium]MCG2654781.1 NAD(P)/FAD-dependent oxidoreductase [Hydrogenophaga sp.]
MQSFDVVVVGAGAAGLFCAGVAGQRGLKVLVLDHSEAVAEKIRISGGGRANFTNRDIDVRQPHKHFVSENPNFCRSALSRYTPADFIALMQKHGISFHEKHKGQLFCDRSAEDLIAMLLAECEAGGVTRWQPCGVKALRVAEDGSYDIDTERGTVSSRAVVIATGGLSIPKIGATDFGYRMAKQFGLRTVEPRPGLVPLTFDGEAWASYAGLSGLSLPVLIETGDKKNRISFAEDLLFTHRGLSGPAVLQISSYWREGTPIRLNLAPEVDLPAALARAKATSRKLIANELATLVPSRLADAWVAQDKDWQRPISEASDKALARLAERLSRWELVPTGSEGYKKAEVTLGGVDTRDLSSQTMESKQPGLYFIGEVVDVTGWLGGYNFQWAWASAHACAVALSEQKTA